MDRRDRAALDHPHNRLALQYNEPQLGRLILHTALVFLISPVGGQFGLLLQKEFEFGTLAVCEIISAIFAASVTIIAAIEGLGVFSLVLGRLGGACLTTGLFGVIGWRRWHPGVICPTPSPPAAALFTPAGRQARVTEFRVGRRAPQPKRNE